MKNKKKKTKKERKNWVNRWNDWLCISIYISFDATNIENTSIAVLYKKAINNKRKMQRIDSNDNACVVPVKGTKKLYKNANLQNQKVIKWLRTSTAPKDAERECFCAFQYYVESFWLDFSDIYSFSFNQFIKNQQAPNKWIIHLLTDQSIEWWMHFSFINRFRFVGACTMPKKDVFG